MDFTLTQKERMLLEDQKNHESICIEKYSKYANLANDTQLKQLFKANESAERSHLDSINQLLTGTLPQMNQQQNQAPQNDWTNSPAGTAISDKDLCTDLLMTEKYVSGAYDTAIFECKDSNVRQVLNHIQKEEQQHGEAIFQYMNGKGMYNPQ